MKVFGNRRSILAVIVMAMLLAGAAPVTSFASDHGRDRGRDNRDHGRHRGRDNRGRDWTKHNRKCGKFVNCHDARDGRWDGRGPRGDRVGNVVWRNRLRQRNRVADRRLLWQRRALRVNR